MSASPLTLTTLLNSLHTHLQTQTQLLPTLHAQLGLPPTALADELSALQQQLMQGVELQIETRRKEVEEWLMKCEEIESACIRYGKALGGNVKVTGSSVGELRREHVLPRRYELVSEYQEKLRQLYHTKLEQLMTLTNRLSVLARTLGSEFYAPDIAEPTPAQGEDPHDPTANRDVTPERFSKLEKELVRGKGEVNKRLTQLSSTLVQIDWLYTELGITPPSLDDLPTSASLTVPSLTRPSSSCSTSTSGSDPFAASQSTPTPSSRSNSKASFTTPTSTLTLTDPPPPSSSTYPRIFASFVLRLEEADAESLPEGTLIGLEGVEPTPGLLSWAASTAAALEDTKRAREAHIQAMYDQLEGLWRRLGVAEGDMDAFVEAHRGSTEGTIRAYEEELERMLELKRERMGAFVGSAREEIGRLWEELMVGEEERADFAPFFDDEHTEELLTIHEEEIKRLKEERRMKAPLLAGIRKYFEICEEEKELAAAASDQTRLLGRGPRDPSRLLREEKMRKRVNKEKPRLEQDMLASIPAWEDEAGRPFLVHGESILRILMDTVGAADQENGKRTGENGKRRGQQRAGSVPARSTTPSNSYVPGRSTGVVTPAVRPGSSMSSSVPAKRPRLNESTYGPTPRAPLGSHRGPATNGSAHRSTSPSKIPGASHGHSHGKPTSSLPRPVAMPVPRPGTQHHALGHGRVPSAHAYQQPPAHAHQQPPAHAYQQPPAHAHQQPPAQAHQQPPAHVYQQPSAHAHQQPPAHAHAYHQQPQRSVSSSTYGAGAAKKATRARRESFKPRPSMDEGDLGRSVGDLGRSVGDLGRSVGVGRWAGFAVSVKEEEEGY
ncbi:hypothetical protein PLICRDRAFT_165888 [Plicaturopsis crispa FD-325 SS-3]|nr:hypothetical protein PLICRDRAFT_165888 [Plicaturopsis crispa FD-325 SS-3]